MRERTERGLPTDDAPRPPPVTTESLRQRRDGLERMLARIADPMPRAVLYAQLASLEQRIRAGEKAA